jgi:hypothetical protein
VLRAGADPGFEVRGFKTIYLFLQYQTVTSFKTDLKLLSKLKTETGLNAPNSLLSI